MGRETDTDGMLSSIIPSCQMARPAQSRLPGKHPEHAYAAIGKITTLADHLPGSSFHATMWLMGAALAPTNSGRQQQHVIAESWPSILG